METTARLTHRTSRAPQPHRQEHDRSRETPQPRRERPVDVRRRGGATRRGRHRVHPDTAVGAAAPRCSRCVHNSRWAAATDEPANAALATNTTSRSSRMAQCRAASRSRRLQRLRATALPTRRDATTATRAAPPSTVDGATWVTSSRPARCCRPRITRVMSAPRRRRSCPPATGFTPTASTGRGGDGYSPRDAHRWSASGRGSRACGIDDGCWAERCASQRASGML